MDSNGKFMSQFAREMAKSQTIFEKERRPMRRGLSESDLLDKDVVDMLNESLYNFTSVASLPPPSVEDDWLSPQKFRDILDKKEMNWKQSNQASNAISDHSNRPTVIARDYTMPTTTNTNLDMDKVEDDLVRLEKENLRLRQQLFMMRQSKENEGSGCQESKNYEELMNEVDRLKSVVNKMENSKTMYDASTMQLASFLETFASQLASGNQDSLDRQHTDSLDRQTTDSFDSLLSRPSFDSGSYRPAESGSYRPAESGSYKPADIDSYRHSLSSYNTVQSRPSVDSYKTIDSYTSMARKPDSYKSHGALPPIYSNIGYNRSPHSYRKLPKRAQASIKLPNRSDSFNCILDSRKQLYSRDFDELGRNVAAVGPGRSRILMGSNTMRRALTRNHGRQASSSVDLVAESLHEKGVLNTQVKTDIPKNHYNSDKGALKCRSKSIASGLSNKIVREVEDKSNTNKQSDNKPKTKVQKFLLQLRNLVVKDKPRADPKAAEIKTGLDDTEDSSHVNRTVIRIGNSISRSKSQKIPQSQFTPKKRLKPSHQSTPRLL